MIEARRLAQQEADEAKLINLRDALTKIAQGIVEAVGKLLDAANKILLDIPSWEAPEEVTRGLRDRSPTTRTNSARVHQASGARDAQRAGCTMGLLLYPGL
jgi:hypothetical protein